MTSLYLDTARLGVMTTAARRASLAFTRLVSDDPASPRFDEFLEEGMGAWPLALRSRYAGLSDWQGLAALKTALRARVEAPPELPVFLASRTAQLMRLAARVLFRRCHRVLTTDMEWPAYRHILEEEAQRRGRQLAEVPLRQTVLDDRATAEEVVSLVARHYQAKDCEGLFISSVTYQGLRLPVRDISRNLTVGARPPFVVVDGAQGFCHAPAELASGYCDLFLGGTHKWLRAYHPMGVGFCGRTESTDFIKKTCEGMMADEGIDDPLLHFTSRREHGVRERFTETVSLAPLFPCAAALAENLQCAPCPRKRFAELVFRVRELEKLSEGSDWDPLIPHPSLRSGIMLLRVRNSKVWTESPENLRSFFQSQGVSLTAYEGGVLRLSAQLRPLPEVESGLFESALRKPVLDGHWDCESSRNLGTNWGQHCPCIPSAGTMQV